MEITAIFTHLLSLVFFVMLPPQVSFLDKTPLHQGSTLGEIILRAL